MQMKRESPKIHQTSVFSVRSKNAPQENIRASKKQIISGIARSNRVSPVQSSKCFCVGIEKLVSFLRIDSRGLERLHDEINAVQTDKIKATTSSISRMRASVLAQPKCSAQFSASESALRDSVLNNKIPTRFSAHPAFCGRGKFNGPTVSSPISPILSDFRVSICLPPS